MLMAAPELSAQLSGIRRWPMTITRFKSNPRMSQAVAHKGVLYLAGQIGAPGENAAAQTTAILASVDALLSEAGSTRAKILSATIWLADIADFNEMNAVWDAWVDQANPPARATVEAKLAAPSLKVEIAIIAALD